MDTISDAEMAEMLENFIQWPDSEGDEMNIDNEGVLPRYVSSSNDDGPRSILIPVAEPDLAVQPTFPYCAASPVLPGQSLDPEVRAEVRAYERRMGFSSIPAQAACATQRAEHQREWRSDTVSPHDLVLDKMLELLQPGDDEHVDMMIDNAANVDGSEISDMLQPKSPVSRHQKGKQNEERVPPSLMGTEYQDAQFIENRRRAMIHGARRIKWNRQRLQKLMRVDEPTEIQMPEMTSIDCGVLDGKAVRIGVSGRDAEGKVTFSVIADDQEWTFEAVAKNFNLGSTWTF